jgi:hypothetical protein
LSLQWNALTLAWAKSRFGFPSGFVADDVGLAKCCGGGSGVNPKTTGWCEVPSIDFGCQHVSCVVYRFTLGVSGYIEDG